MVRSLLIRGMLIGILAGMLAFAFATVFGEPQIDRAIAFEESQSRDEAKALADSQQHDQGADAELVSRRVQASWGLLAGVLVQGAALGGIFALAFAFAQGRLGSLGPRATAGMIALAGFMAVVFLPQLKYPANPPAVGMSETIGPRTALYFAIMAVSIVAMIAAFSTANSLTARLGRWNANLVAAAAYLVVMALAMTVLPSVNEVPQDFSADLLWKFRIASLGVHVTLWTTLGIVFGIAAERLFPAARPGFSRHG